MANSYPQIQSIASKYDTDSIFIVGKGPSIDEARSSIFADSLVININDSEKIVPGDIAIFHADWVVQSLASTGCNCGLYVTPCDMPEGVTVLRAEYVPPTPESSELLIQRFRESRLRIESVLLISAFKVAKIIADVKMRRQSVYAVGFDFDTSRGLSRAMDQDHSGDDRDYAAHFVSAQEHFFVMFAYLLRDSNVLIHHVGKKSYSKLTYAELNERFGEAVDAQSMQSIAPTARHLDNDVKLEKTAPDHVVVTAELTTNHFGDLARLQKMVWRAKECGADYVKVQKRDVETFYGKEQLDSPFESPFGTTFRDYRVQLELDREGFACLREMCQKVGIGWFVSILDLKSFRFMRDLGVAMIKLPSTISQHTEFLQTVAREFDGDLVVSTGFTEQEYEEFVLKTFSNNRRVYLLQCTSAYPTRPDDCNVAVIRHYDKISRRHPHIVPGYSSHDYGSLASMLAIAAGARMIEKHVKLGDAPWAHFDGVAMDLDGDEFATFVSDVRQAERVVGREQKRILDSEHHKYWAPHQGSV